MVDGSYAPLEDSPAGCPPEDERFDWVETISYLESLTPGTETDDYIDMLAGRVLEGDWSEGAIPALLLSLGAATSALTLESAALALASAAHPPTQVVVDALRGRFELYKKDSYLSCAFLGALGLLALRDAGARAAVIYILLFIKPDENRHLLVQAAKWAGRINAIQQSPELLQKLTEFASSSDPAVCGEALHQSAMEELGEALLSPDQDQIKNCLAAVRASFARAAASEEFRLDSSMFVHLLDLLLAFWQIPIAQEQAIREIGRLQGTITAFLRDPTHSAWSGYQTEEERLLELRIEHVADAMGKAAAAVREVEAWTNFDEALVELAAIYCQIQYHTPIPLGAGRVENALAAIAGVVMAPRLGPLLRSITRLRLKKVVERYALQHGEDDLFRAMNALKNAAFSEDHQVDTISDTEVLGEIEALAVRIGERPHDLLNRIRKGIEEEEFNRWLECLGLRPATLSIDHPYLYGGDPAVDRAVRSVLREARILLSDFPRGAGIQLIKSLIVIVQFVRDVRDDLPEYSVCVEDGGLGQTASEDDLRDDLFGYLRMEFGRAAVIEHRSVAGGRTDTGLEFDDCSFPIEVKAEFHTIDRRHIRLSYLGQPDAYAAVRERISFLMILDLRDANAAGHQKRVKDISYKDEPYSLYSLDSSFWVEGLPSDPHHHVKKRNAVIVGLVPGNRPVPSGMTNYSKRPKKARRKRRTPSSG